MRYLPGHKQATRHRILESAGSLMRREGIHDTSVDSLMAAAGLSRGGFYAYFSSKSAMTAETLRRVMAEVRTVWIEGIEAAGRDWLPVLLGRYLNRRHWKNADTGCPIPALAAEVHRSPVEVRAAFEEELLELIAELENLPSDAGDRRELAIATIALCVGGMSLARAVSDPEISDEILCACRRTGRNAGKL